MNTGIETGPDPFADQLAAYALGAVDPDEIELIEAHLATCEPCRAELERFQIIVAALAFSLEPIAEPAGHQARFQQKLAGLAGAEPQGHRDRFLQKLEAQDGSVATPGRAAVVGQPSSPAPRRSPAPSLAQPWWQRWNLLGGWALAGALAVALIFAVLAGQDARRTSDAATLQLQTAQQQIATTTSERNTLAAVLGNPDAHAKALTGQINGQTVQAFLWFSPGTQQVVLTTDSLPPAPNGKVYELWLFKGQTPVAVDVIRSDAPGRGLLIFQVAGSLADYQQAAITVESGKVDKPTSKPVVVGQI